MDKPIISPWVFYFADIADNCKFVVLILAVVSLTWFMVYFIAKYGDDVDVKLWKPVALGIVTLLMGLFVPSSDAIYKMVAAKMLTPNNITVVTEYADNMVNDATDVLESVMDYGVDRIYDIRNNQKVGETDE